MALTTRSYFGAGMGISGVALGRTASRSRIPVTDQSTRSITPTMSTLSTESTSIVLALPLWVAPWGGAQQAVAGRALSPGHRDPSAREAVDDGRHIR